MRADYVDLGYEPGDDEVVCLYYMEPAEGCTVEESANHIAGESSIDTWSDIATLSKDIAELLKPHVFSIKDCGDGALVKIAYTPQLFEADSIPQLLSSIAGNIFGMKKVKNLRLLDVHLPREILKNFNGPLFGVDGIRRTLKVKRPVLGTIVKPKVGLTSEKHADVAYRAWLGGIDFVKDDENLTNQGFNPFKKRALLTLKAREKAERETGEAKAYACNVTARSCEEMVKRMRFLKAEGARYAMVDIITVGFAALQTLRERNDDIKLIIHAHRCMHAAFTRNERHGISMLVITKLMRMLGVDELHIGTVIGKMHGKDKEVLACRESCLGENVKEKSGWNMLKQNWNGFRKLMPVASGGLHPLMIPKLYEIFGNDVVLQFGGGVHAHPRGTLAGAKACRQAMEAVLDGIELKDCAKRYRELADAMRKWGK